MAFPPPREPSPVGAEQSSSLLFGGREGGASLQKPSLSLFGAKKNGPPNGLFGPLGGAGATSNGGISREKLESANSFKNAFLKGGDLDSLYTREGLFDAGAGANPGVQRQIFVQLVGC